MNALVKICGITCLDDAEIALRAGATWIGLNLVAGPRKLDLTQVRSILSRLDDPSRAVVLLMLDEGGPPASVSALLRDHGVRRLQLYGKVTPDGVRALAGGGFETIVPWPIAGEGSLTRIGDFLNACADSRPQYLLFDAASPDRLGGTGTRADWATMARARDQGQLDSWPPIILAGGLTPDNVAEAIRKLAPAGVDVSSGVESSPGRKDHGKIAAFLAAVREALPGAR